MQNTDDDATNHGKKVLGEECTVEEEGAPPIICTFQ